MSTVNRREFLSFGAKLAALMGLGSSAAPSIAQALGNISAGNPPVLWLQGQSCSGCSVSLLNADAPTPTEVLTKYIALQFHSTLSTATGHVGMDIVHRVTEEGGYILAVEGSLPEGMPEACLMGHEPVTELVLRAARSAQAVVAVGACAAFGGIPGAANNPTGAVSVPKFLSKSGIRTPIITLPGCPCHPDWVVGTLAHIVGYGLPELDELGRPKMFYSRVLHDQCPRFADYERENFARTFSDTGCLFKLGCMGPRTHADCNLRHWNSRVNSCIKAGAPCIGCASETFAHDPSFPFYTKESAAEATKTQET